ncbi:hypothetical protein [Nostoc flagelliforme]|uniref:hypothetical protein n=1 Tax=Nostoc flagelliforme TaxID=1306274 RepID=UPI001F557164|nr:hypothetical protein [Nostoc flagelliforme]
MDNYLGLFWKAVIWTGIAIAALWLLIYVSLVKPYLVEAVIPQRGNVWNVNVHRSYPATVKNKYT